MHILHHTYARTHARTTAYTDTRTHVDVYTYASQLLQFGAYREYASRTEINCK